MTHLIIGPPGTGKTTRISVLVNECLSARKRPLLCSLTRTAAGEIARRGLPVHKDSIGTLHAHAFRALGLDRDQVAEARIAEWNAANPAFALGSDARADIDDPYAEPPAKTEHSDKLLSDYQVQRARMVPRDHWPLPTRRFASRWEAWKHDNRLLDFTDMIEEAACSCDRAPTSPDVILVDEAQDMSALELDLLHRWALAAGQLVIVGDPWQALYTWRGARPEMFHSDKLAMENCSVLAQSYRIPINVHAAAIKWIRRLSHYRPIEYKPRPEAGHVQRFAASFRHPEVLVNEVERELANNRTVMVCAPCGYMLGPTIALLRKRVIPFCNPWRWKRGDWNPLGGGKAINMGQRLLEFLRWDEKAFGPPDEPVWDMNAAPSLLGGARVWTFSELRHWVDVLGAQGLLVDGAKSFVQTMADGETQYSQRTLTIADIEALFTPEAAAFLTDMLEGGVPTNEALSWYRSHLLGAKAKAARFPIAVAKRRGPRALGNRPGLYVGTIHSFKGAEADTVFIFPDLSPRGWAEWLTPGEGRDSIYRMFYVALTRARERVYLCEASTPQSVKLWALVNR